MLGVIQALQARVKLSQNTLEEHRAMSWDALLEMQAAGITIGSHSRTHAVLPNESAEKVQEEARSSREALERRLGKTIRHFAYPCGQYDQSDGAEPSPRRGIVSGIRFAIIATAAFRY